MSRSELIDVEPPAELAFLVAVDTGSDVAGAPRSRSRSWRT